MPDDKKVPASTDGAGEREFHDPDDEQFEAVNGRFENAGHTAVETECDTVGIITANDTGKYIVSDCFLVIDGSDDFSNADEIPRRT